jgi:hypothetical protein
MVRRVCIPGALLLALVLCPRDARAHCHDPRALADNKTKGLSRAECRSFVLVDYTEAWGNEQRSADDLLTPDAEIVIEESPLKRYRGAEARRKFREDQVKFRGTYYTPVVTGGSHVSLEPDGGEGLEAENLARVTWTGVVRCVQAGCGKDVAETVVAILVQQGRSMDQRPRWKIVSASIQRTEIKPPPGPAAAPKT